MTKRDASTEEGTTPSKKKNDHGPSTQSGGAKSPGSPGSTKKASGTRRKTSAKSTATSKKKKVESPSAQIVQAFRPHLDLIISNILVPAVRRAIVLPSCHDLDDLIALLASEHDIVLTPVQLQHALSRSGIELEARLAIVGEDAYPQETPEQELSGHVFASGLAPHVVGANPPAQHHVVEEVVPQEAPKYTPPKAPKVDIASMIPDPGGPSFGGARFTRTIGGALDNPIIPQAEG